MLWAVWFVLAVAAYGRPVWTSTRLLFDPFPPALAAHLRAQATVAGSWLQICCALAAVVLIGITQINRGEVGLRRTTRTRLVPGRGVGATVAYLFLMSAAAAMTAQVLAALHTAARVYPGAAEAAHNSELARAFLFGSVGAGVGEEMLLFAVPIALARRCGWSTPATITLVTALRLAIHTYYSWGSLFVLLWIPAGYALYRAAGSIWPLIMGHTVYDAIHFSIDSWPPAGDVLVAVNLPSPWWAPSWRSSATTGTGAAGRTVDDRNPPRRRRSDPIA